MGGGSTAHNTAIVRANYLTPGCVAKETVELFRRSWGELDINIMYSKRSHFASPILAAMRTPALSRTGRTAPSGSRLVHVGGAF